MLIEKLAAKEEFTSNEVFIADYILKNKEKVLQMTAEDLAARTFTSKAAVTRLCKKLGMSGYREFQRTYGIELQESYRVKALLSHEPVNENTSVSEIMGIVPSMYDSAISRTRMLMDPHVVARAVKKMKKAVRIELYGSGATLSVAQTAAFKYSTLGLPCAAYSGVNEHYIVANEPNDRSVAIVLSFTGGNTQMAYIASFLRSHGYYVLGIGGHTEDRVRKRCSDYITVEQNELTLTLEIIRASMGTAYVLDVLFVSLVSSDYQNQVKNALRTRQEQSLKQNFKTK